MYLSTKVNFCVYVFYNSTFCSSKHFPGYQTLSLSGFPIFAGDSVAQWLERRIGVPPAWVRLHRGSLVKPAQENAAGEHCAGKCYRRRRQSGMNIVQYAMYRIVNC